MPEKSKETNAELAARYADQFLNLCTLFKNISLELWDAYQSKTLPYSLCLIPGTLLCACLYFELDRPFFGFRFLQNIYHSQWFFLPYYFFIVSSGFWLWGYILVQRSKNLNGELQKVFVGIKVKNGWKRVPQFICDRAIDGENRRLTLSREMITLEQFRSNSNEIASALNVYIENIEEDRIGGNVDIFYSIVEMPKKFECADYVRFPHCSFLVGKTRGKEIIGNLLNSPHLLVAGESGGGKSSFLRHLIVTLYLNNLHMRFLFIDLKENLEGQIFNSLARIEVTDNAKEALDKLLMVSLFMTERFAQLKEAGAKDLEDYERIRHEKQKTIDAAKSELPILDRLVVVIDEAAQLYLVTDKNEASQVKDARKIVSEVARMGRALGVHLVFGTQRPDVSAIDSQVKSCLTSVLAFKAANNASSMTILDNTRAANLPQIPGRGIWKVGGEMTEIQTPLLEKTRVSQLLGKEVTEQPPSPPPANPVTVRKTAALGIYKANGGSK